MSEANTCVVDPACKLHTSVSPKCVHDRCNRAGVHMCDISEKNVFLIENKRQKKKSINYDILAAAPHILRVIGKGSVRDTARFQTISVVVWLSAV